MHKIPSTRPNESRRENALLVGRVPAARPPQAGSAKGNRRVAVDSGPSDRALALQARLAALEREFSELQQAVYSAAQLQRTLCAPRLVRRGRFEIASEIFPVRHLSGDFYQVLDFGGATGLVVGDIAGKGLSAGLWLTHLTGLVRMLFQSADPAAAAAAINHELWKVQPDTPMVALFLAWLDHHRGELVYCNAGQPEPLLLHSDGSTQTLDAGGPVLGAVQSAPFSCGRILLAPGDTLVVSTDGILECRNARDQEFRAAGLLLAARRADRSSASNLLFSLFGAAQDFAGSRPPVDDLTLMVLHRLE